MRLFVAIEIAADTANAAARLAEDLRRRTRSLTPAARVTWIPPERLHVTVRFIGEVDDDTVPAVVAALQPPMVTGAFALGFGGAGAFPPNAAPRVLWAGITAGLESLRALEREISARLGSVGIPADAHDYNPHLTLARVRHPAGLRPGPLLERLAERPLGGGQVDAITLFHSRLSPRGPAYVPLLRTVLSGPKGP